jgi:hypothetical protein
LDHGDKLRASDGLTVVNAFKITIVYKILALTAVQTTATDLHGLFAVRGEWGEKG